MSEQELLSRLQRLEAEVLELRRQLGNLPVRFGGGGGAGASIPPGKGIYKILMRLDDLENGAIGWDYARFHLREEVPAAYGADGWQSPI